MIFARSLAGNSILKRNPEEFLREILMCVFKNAVFNILLGKHSCSVFEKRMYNLPNDGRYFFNYYKISNPIILKVFYPISIKIPSKLSNDS
jgi:hypothetical protein